MSSLQLTGLALVAVLLLPGGASAGPHEDCANLSLSMDHKTADPQIAACTKAIAAAQRANDRKRLTEAYNRRGLGYLDKKDLDLALADFSEAIKISPGYVRALDNRADVYREKKEFDLALKDYNEALRLDSSHISAYVNRGILHKLRGDTQSARADFQTVLARPRDDRNPLNKWAKDLAEQQLKELDKQ